MKCDDIKISIIIPLYNQEKYIARCLDSILLYNQVDSIEIIIVNDGSTDGSMTIVKHYCEQYDNIILISQKNMGLGAARNAGTECARGTYIWYVDADDTIRENSLKTLYGIAIEKELDMLIFDLDEVSMTGKLICHAKSCVSELNDKIFTALEKGEVFGGIQSASNRLIRKELIRRTQVQFPNRICFEDLMTIPKLLCQANKISYISQPFYNYFQNQGSIMHSGNLEKYRDILLVMKNLEEYIKEQGLWEQLKDEIEYLVIFHGYLMVSARMIKEDCKCTYVKDIKKYIYNIYGKYHKNPYIRRLSIKHRISLRCLDMEIYYPLYIFLNR